MNKIPNLFVLLKERNVSRKELCSAIGVTNSNITGWKNGDYAPSIDVVIQIAHYFNVSTDYLLGVAEMPIAPIVITEGDLFSTPLSSTISKTPYLRQIQRTYGVFFMPAKQKYTLL